MAEHRVWSAQPRDSLEAVPESAQSPWSVLQSTRRGPSDPLPTLQRLPKLSIWLSDIRAVFDSSSQEARDHHEAAEWFLDNYYHVQRAVRQIRLDMPKGFFRRLPVLCRGIHEGLPRIYVVASEILDQTDLLPDSGSTRESVDQIQEHCPLSMSELWALPVFMRLRALEELVSSAAAIVTNLPSPFPSPATTCGARRRDNDERVACAVQALRTIDTIDWRDLFCSTSVVERCLAKDPAGVYAQMDFESRDRCRKAIEEISWQSGVQEDEVAQAALALCREERLKTSPGKHVGYWLIDEGRCEFERRFNVRPAPIERVRRALTSHPTTSLLASISIVTALLMVFPAEYLIAQQSSPWILLWLLLLLLPASTLAISFVHWLLTNLLPPRVLPKLKLDRGVPNTCRTLVAIPCLLGSESEVQGLVRQLEVHHLRNEDPNLEFALISDFLDAKEETTPSDADLIRRATASIRLLNRKYGRGGHLPFHLIHRQRQWNPSEGVWMGWERKRGKLEELNAWLLESKTTSIQHIAGERSQLTGIRYVITLDAGTMLPRGSASRLIGTLAHPLNQARVDPQTGRLSRGYTVIQPRVEIAPTASGQSLFTRLFAGDSAIDIYSRAVSDVYQDLWGQGVYVGKGIYDIEAFSQSLTGRVPENALVSHDHFEGLHGRAALATDITLYEDYPSQYLAYARRMHRWMRGDWQLLPWLGRKVPTAEKKRARNQLTLLGRWILFDNLRRSLLAPALLLLLIASWLWLPGHPLAWMVFGALAPAGHVFTGLVSGLTRGPRRTRMRSWLARLAHPLRQNLGRWAMFLAFMAHESLVSLDAIMRTLNRLLFTRRRFLEWRTAEHTAVLLAKRNQHLLYWTEMFGSPLLATATLVSILYWRPQSLPWSAPFLGVWFMAPEIAKRVSQPFKTRSEPIESQHVDKLRRLARRTWLFFEIFVNSDEQWLPPDNYQEDPRGDVAHRTSPTNIGMYLTSIVSAHDFGWLGPTDLMLRSRNTLDTMARMESHRGHIYNWYDTRTLEPLLPHYVSSVDSGNLAACLLVLQQACAEATARPILSPNRWRGLQDCLHLLEESLATLSQQAPQLDCRPLFNHLESMQDLIAVNESQPHTWCFTINQLCGPQCETLDELILSTIEDQVTSSGPIHLREIRVWIARTHQHLRAMKREVEELAPWAPLLDQACESLRASSLFEQLSSLLHLELRLADVPVQCGKALDLLKLPSSIEVIEQSATHADCCAQLLEALNASSSHVTPLRNELLNIGVRSEALVRQMDFRFLYDDDCSLFHIGYNVTSGKLDPNHYDLLASEARIASFIAIAKGEVPVKHWFFLGRPLTRIQGNATLLSWSATMFEYLMPSLVLKSADRTLLEQSCHSAVDAQIDHGRRNEVPWGVSESGFYQFDADRNYQYRAFGVPGLGLKRGLNQDMVVAPYASVLALSIRPQAVLKNLDRMLELGACGTYGLYEALDFTPVRVHAHERFAVVRSHMSHHQGMVIAAVNNALNADPLIRRFHATSLAQSADLLLHEQVPIGSPPSLQVDSLAVPPVPLRPAIDMPSWRPSLDGPIPETHSLGNGRMSTLLTEAGGGSTDWRGLALTRWSPDPTRDAQGTWIYVRDEETREYFSVTQNPTGIESSEQYVIFQLHSVEFHLRQGDLFLHTDITVAPEDDVEVRLVSVTNESSRPREISLTSYLEPVLAPARDDRRHPAFSKLFLESRYVPEHQGLLFRRRARTAEERPVVMLHRWMALDERSTFGGFESDRETFLGRGNTTESPLALSGRGPLSGTEGAVLDPIASLRCTLRLDPGQTSRVAFMTMAAGSEECVSRLSRRYQSKAAIDWVFEASASKVLREFTKAGLEPSLVPSLQRLTTLLHCPFVTLTSTSKVPTNEANELGREALWSHGISGDFPILLVEVADAKSAQLLRELTQAQEWWRRRGTSVALVVLLLSSSSYSGDQEERINRVIAREGASDRLNRRGGIFIVHADQMDADEVRLLRRMARVALHTANGRLSDQAPEIDWVEDTPATLLHSARDREFDELSCESSAREERLFDNEIGGFSKDGKEYVIEVGADSKTPAPWSNVLANPNFGCLLSESSLGVTWSVNSAEHRITPWRNETVSDVPAEVVYVRDEESGEVWTPTPQPLGAAARFTVRHNAGWSEYISAQQGVEQRLRVFVPIDDPVKVLSLRLNNKSRHPRRLTITYFAELVLGVSRDDPLSLITHEQEPVTGALMSRNSWNETYASRVAFLVSSEFPHGVTVDRFEFLGKHGSLQRPAALERWGLTNRLKSGVDPCHALMVHVDLKPGAEHEVHFALGDGSNRAQTLNLVEWYREAGMIEAAFAKLRSHWESQLGSVEVKTPDSAMDLMVNRWLPYQAVTSRLLGRIGPYQASGAFGFRDQLQDVMLLVHSAPEQARDHILLAASKQFAEGDVLHWWHEPFRGIRTRCSDDLLWLPYVACHYSEATGDLDIFQEQVHFLDGDPLAEGEDERFANYSPSKSCASLLEHCRRALERSLERGPRELPLIGSCDWNDGFSRVGSRGVGESVWLGWFSIATSRAFSRLLVKFSEPEEAERWRDVADQLQLAIEREAWDGKWYQRAFYDDGEPIGSSKSDECQIDLIAQAWAAMAGDRDSQRSKQAVDSSFQHLVMEDEHLIRLLFPPFDKGKLDPGYIKAYPPGIRENGGQYTHAATWLGWAAASLGDGERAHDVFRFLNPILHSNSKDEATCYRTEPYVVAADVYTCPPHTGRGGWTWYTGAASWLWRLGVEAILGIQRVNGDLCVNPCIPPNWDGYEAHVRTPEVDCLIRVQNPDGVSQGVAYVEFDGRKTDSKLIPLKQLEGQHEVVVRMGKPPSATSAPD